MQWDLFSFDVKAAFLQGNTQEGRTIAIEPTPELRKAMNLKENEVCQLAKSAYGLVDAPFLWFKELDRTLRKLLFIPNGLCGGNKYFHEKLAQLEPFFHLDPKRQNYLLSQGLISTKMPTIISLCPKKNIFPKLNLFTLTPPENIPLNSK